MGTDRTVRSRPHAGAPPEHSGGASSSHARSHTALTKCADSPVLGCPELALRGRPGRPRTVVTTCAMGDRHSSRRMDTTARGHGERVIALRQQRAAFGVQGCVGRWPCHTRARADAVGGTPHFFRLRPLRGAAGSHPVRGTASVEIRTISGPAVLPKSRRALFALVSNALPLCHQQTEKSVYWAWIRYLGSAVETRGDAAALVRGTDVTTSPAAVRLNRGSRTERQPTVAHPAPREAVHDRRRLWS